MNIKCKQNWLLLDKTPKRNFYNMIDYNNLNSWLY